MITVKLGRDLRAFRLPKDVEEILKVELTMVNPKYTQAVANRRFWNLPEKFLFCYEKKKRFIALPIGYYETFLQICRQHKIELDIIDLRKEVPAKFQFYGDLRDYQENAVQDLLEYDNGVLEAGTGAGKTVMALRLIAERKQRTLVIVHTKELLNQWQERAIKFLGLRPEEIGVIGDGKCRLGMRFTVGIVNSIFSRQEELRNEFGHIVVDECHRTPSRTFNESVGALNAKYKLGLTATAGRNDNLTDLIFWYIGASRHCVNKKMLVDEGHIVMPQFIIRSTGYTASEKLTNDYVHLIQDLTSNSERNEMICSDIVDAFHRNSQIIILSDRKPHCAELQRILLERYGLQARLLTGDTKPDERRRIITGIGSDKAPVIATGQLIGEGFDSKELDTMFITTPIKFKGRITQYIGRIMRPDKDKGRPVVYDYVDWDVKPLRTSAHSRMRVYGNNNIIQQ